MHEEVKEVVFREITPTQRTEYRPRSVQGITKTRCELVGTIEGGGYEKTLEKNRRVYSTDGISPTITTRADSDYGVLIMDKCELLGTIEGGGYEKMFEEIRRVYGVNGCSPAITAKRGGHHEVKIMVKNANKKGYEEAEDGDFINLQYVSSSPSRGRVGKQVAQTLCCTDEQGVAVEAPFAYDEQNRYARSDGTVGTLTTNGSSPKHNNRVVVPNDEKTEKKDNLRIRKLTPLECWRLMDFDDEDFRKAEAIESNTQLYAQAGNSIVVNCLVAIFGQMFEGKEHIYEK